MALSSFEFDAFSIIECGNDELIGIEAQQIHLLQPTGNKMFPAYGGAPYMERNVHVAKMD